MSAFLSLANQLITKVFTIEPYAVKQVKIDDYRYYDIVTRENTLILYSYCNQKNQNIYEIVLHRENSPQSSSSSSTLSSPSSILLNNTAYSLYRSTLNDEAQLYFIRLHDKLPVFASKFPNLLNVSTIEEICKYINSNPSQSLAHICANFGYVDYFRQLSNEPIEDVNSIINKCEDDQQKTCLQIAIEQQRLNVLQTILSIPNIQIDYNHCDNSGNNLLHIAAKSNEQIVSLLCSKIKSSNESSGNDLLNELINAKNNDNFAPLYLACLSDKPSCVKELLKNGADVNGASILDHHKSKTNDNNDQSTSTSSSSSSRDNSPSELNDDRLINMLNVKDMKNGGTPLHWSKSPEVIELLSERNCNLNAKNFHGNTALHNMVIQSKLDCVISLLGHGANIDAMDSDGNTPLHLSINTNNISIVQALIVFGADLDIRNSLGQTARHLAATSKKSPAKDTILYILNSVNASRCWPKLDDCSEGCAKNLDYNGVPPENPFVRNLPLFDKILLNDVVKNSLEQKIEPKNEEMADIGDTENPNGKNLRKNLKLLCMDGGGIRGLIIIQILCYLETVTGKNIVDLFDWIAGTSTGGILALLLSNGYSAIRCRQLYFLLKDKIFTSYRPYCSDTLERFLKKYLGTDKRMMDITKPKLLIPATNAERFPPSATFYRNYSSSNDVLYGLQYSPNDIDSDMNDGDNNNNNKNNELLWKVARATGAAPTYFSQFETFLDGGLIANNPTMDLLHEIQFHNRTIEFLNKKDEPIYDIDLVVSIGTGLIPSRKIDPIQFGSIFSFSGISSLATNFQTLMKVLVEQASLANGRVVDRAQAWCSMINVPFFRLNPAISEEIQMDESNDVKLINMLWETMAYIYMHQDDFNSLITLLLYQK